MKPIRRLRVPPEWGRPLFGDSHPPSRPLRKWPFYLLVMASMALIAAGALKHYFTQP